MALHYSPQINFHTLPDDGLGTGDNEIPITGFNVHATSIDIYFLPVGDGWTYRALIFSQPDGDLLYTGAAYDIPQDLDTSSELIMTGLTPSTNYRFRIEACDDGEFAPSE